MTQSSGSSSKRPQFPPGGSPTHLSTREIQTNEGKGLVTESNVFNTLHFTLLYRDHETLKTETLPLVVHFVSNLDDKTLAIIFNWLGI